MRAVRCQFAKRLRFLVACGSVFLASSALTGESIFRCDAADGSVTFSDSPCDAQAREYHSAATLSVISTPQNLAERIEANRAFIDQRRERLRVARETSRQAAGRQTQVSQTSTSASAAIGTRSGLLPVPYWLPAHEQPTPQPSREPAAREERFSALSGRQIGSVRRPNEADNNRPSADPQ